MPPGRVANAFGRFFGISEEEQDTPPTEDGDAGTESHHRFSFNIGSRKRQQRKDLVDSHRHLVEAMRKMKHYVSTLHGILQDLGDEFLNQQAECPCLIFRIQQLNLAIQAAVKKYQSAKDLGETARAPPPAASASATAAAAAAAATTAVAAATTAAAAATAGKENETSSLLLEVPRRLSVPRRSVVDAARQENYYANAPLDELEKDLNAQEQDYANLETEAKGEEAKLEALTTGFKAAKSKFFFLRYPDYVKLIKAATVDCLTDY